MSLRKIAGFSVLALAWAGSPAAHARDAGPSAAQWFNDLYGNTRKNCGDASRPAYLCSGVLLRATAPTTAFQFFSISPLSQAVGGVSVSYLRKDAKFGSFYAGRSSGFVLDNHGFDARSVQRPLQARCFFPVDGASFRRKDGGCGDYELTAAVEASCDRMGVFTAEQWLELYLSDSQYAQGAQCGFDMKASNAIRAKHFYEGIRAEGMLHGISVFVANDSQANELVVLPWNASDPSSIPVAASYYTDTTGLPGARLIQIQWYQATGKVLPAVRLDMPAKAEDDARFGYEWQEQAIQPLHEDNACPRYVETGVWKSRRDAGSGQDIASLELTPTACGRTAATSQNNNFFNEVIASYYLSPQWVNSKENADDNIQSMRRQLDCHMRIGRQEAVWSLEPSRPDATIGRAMAAGCDIPLQ